MADGPELTVNLVMHARGRKFTRLVHEVLADGERTGITVTKETNGPPHYYITTHVMRAGDLVFYVTENTPEDALVWLRQRLEERESCAES